MLTPSQLATPGQVATVARLGAAVTVAYASTYYLPAVVAGPIAASLRCSESTVFLAFSAGLLTSALLGPHAGRCVDRWGGRGVLAASNVLFAIGLSALALARDVPTLFLAWVLIGLAMAAGLYETAFSALVRLYGRSARSSITGITLIAGFASTVGWPLSAWVTGEWGWRSACWAWTAVHIVLALPLNLALPRTAQVTVGAVVQAADEPTTSPSRPSKPPPAHAGLALAFVFGVTWFISTAMAAHLPRLLQAHGVGVAAAVACAALVGPAQVAGRLLEYGLLRTVHPLVSARIASSAHALGATFFMLLGVPAAAGLTVLHGMGNGVMTIANGTLPLVFFGPQGYGERQGRLMMPARFAQALAPFVFGLAIERLGSGALWLSAALGAASFAVLAALRPAPAQ